MANDDMSSEVTKRLNRVSADTTNDFLVVPSAVAHRVPVSVDALTKGGGETGALMRSVDWAATPLGPVERWPGSLRAVVNLVMSSRSPIIMWWGPELIQFYNDSYRPILGVAKHPTAMGQRARDCWPEIWSIIEPLISVVMDRGESTDIRDGLLCLDRNGYVEECYFSYAYSPITDETGAVAGIFAAVSESTATVFGRRRERTIRDLNVLSLRSYDIDEMWQHFTTVLAANRHDLQFCMLYLVDGTSATLVLATGLADGAPPTIDLAANAHVWRAPPDTSNGSAYVCPGAAHHVVQAPGGPWPEQAKDLLVTPLVAIGIGQPLGFLVTGLNPRRTLDDAYRAFIDVVTDRIASGLVAVRAYEQERKRAESLAQLDRAKTAFFSNVSHEFRTPLTLMLGPMEDGLSDRGQPLPPRQRERQELIHRNALRLLKLVNTLLDFSRIEAGRAQASFEPIDLSSYTADLASTFRSAIERAKMQLVADCPPLSQPVFVDRDMWEKVVLNVLSNAFKHTFTGSITVSLREVAGQAELRVIDTGIGIPADQIPRLFERFHRVQGADARTHEGSGIGLALAQELVKLHGGSIQVESQIDRGSTFLVSIPLGSNHLPAEQTGATRSRASTAVGANAFVEEALSWIPEGSAAGHRSEVYPASTCEHFDRNVVGDQPDVEADRTVRILLADDNADMRRYVRGILNRRWAVDVVADGAAALEAARAHAPDLILSDVMMPKLDGFGLLREVRADPALRHTPVILLSARAGEEASIEGLKAGADDYLIKPFSAQELIARVAAHLGMARMRRESAQRERALSDAVLATDQQAAKVLESINDGFCTLDSEWRYTSVNPAALQMVPILADALGKSMFDIFPDVRSTIVEDNLHRCVREQTLIEFEFHYEPHGRWYQNRYFGIAGLGVAIVWTDITERKRSEQLLRFRTAQFETLVNRAPLGVYLVDADFRVREVNPIAMTVFGDISGGVIGRDFNEILHILWEKKYGDELVRIFRHTLETGESYVTPERAQFRIDRGITEYYEWQLDRIPSPDGRHGVVCYFRDISQQVQARLRIQESEERFRQMADHAPVMVWVTEVDGRSTFQSQSWYEFTGQTPETGLGFGWLEAVHPDDRASSEATFFAANEKRVAFRLEYRLRRKDGAYRWAIDSAAPRLDPHGEFLGYIGSVLDITDRKQAESDLAESVDDLKRANTELEHFASIASHDLQEPLRMISNYCDILGMRYASSLDEKAKEYFGRITAGSERMRSLLHALLSYSQVDKQPLNLAEAPARAVVDDAMEPLLPEITMKRARVSIGTLPTVVGDRARLTQLLQNLIANALKFSVADRAPLVSITSVDDGERWRFSVADNGIGISASGHKKIFNIFQRLHAADVYPGSGIGLATCKKIVEQHGGRIWVESEADVGSTFCFTILKRLAVSQEQS